MLTRAGELDGRGARTGCVRLVLVLDVIKFHWNNSDSRCFQGSPACTPICSRYLHSDAGDVTVVGFPSGSRRLWGQPFDLIELDWSLNFGTHVTRWNNGSDVSEGFLGGMLAFLDRPRRLPVVGACGTYPLFGCMAHQRIA